MDTSLVAFLAGVAVISLSGVMAPGPVSAVTLAKGQSQPLAGAWVALGHLLVELPLVAFIALGFAGFLAGAGWRMGVGMAGGVVMIVLGVDMVRSRNRAPAGQADHPASALGAGFLLSAANPYFLIWWGTVGAAMVSRALAWGATGVILFFVVHWLCDLGWSLVMSVTAHRTAARWPGGARRVIFGLGGLVLTGFGAWFLWDALRFAAASY